VKLSAWRVALRIARRDALRAKGRSALVIAMIALPVVGVSAADVTYRSSQLTVQQAATRQMGSAAALVSVADQGKRVEQAPNPDDGYHLPSADHPSAEEKARAQEPVDQLLKAALPAGTQLLPIGDQTRAAATTAYGQTHLGVRDLDLASPLTRGMVTLRQGVWPSAPHQVAATTAFLADAGLKVGGTTSLVGSTQALTITAEIEFPSDLSSEQLVGRPGELSSMLAAIAKSSGDSGSSDDLGNSIGNSGSWLAVLPGNAPFGWDAVVKANTYGFTVTSRTVLSDPPPRSAVPLYQDPGYTPYTSSVSASTVTVVSTVAGMALLEIVLLAGPAFAVGARRSRRQLGLIAAGGGDRSHVRGVVLGGGVVLGAVGAAVGILLGTLTVLLGRGWLEERGGARFGGFNLRPLDLLGIVAVGLVTGLLAAVVPALQASRQEVVAALTGRGIVKAPSKRLTVLGAVAVAGGTAIALLGVGVGQKTAGIMGGSMIAELGLVACTPFLVGQFGRLSSRLPLGPRIALRDATRNRGRTAPAVAAVMAAVAGAVAVTAYQQSRDAENRASYTASAPSRAVTLQTWSPKAKADLSAERAAVEHSISGLGPRGDVYRVALGDCTTKECSPASLQLPPERVCPVFAGSNPYGSSGSAGQTAQLSAAQKQTLRTDPRCHTGQGNGGSFDTVVAGDATVLHNLFGTTDPALVQGLAQGRMLVSDARFVKDGKATLSIDVMPDGTDPNATPSTRTISVPAMAFKAPVTGAMGLIGADGAKRVGLSLVPEGSVWLPGQMPTTADEQRASAAVQNSGGEAGLSVERGYVSSESSVALALAIAASVIAIGAAGIATGLAAADSQADLATLAAVGAAPRIRRTLSGFQCGVIAVMGALLGSAAGLVPAAALWNSVHGNDGGASYDPITGVVQTAPDGPLILPWGSMALVVIGLPLLAWLLAAAFTRSRMLMVRRAG
jgi:putative ABC transport system permease protein